MTQLIWDNPGDRLYETGIDRGVLYVPGLSGVPWNGVTTITESPTGGEATPQYGDNAKYLNLISPEQHAGTIEAFTYPEEFEQCDGTVSPDVGFYVGQQTRKAFNLSYRTRLGNDVDGADYGYKIHLLYNAQAQPSEVAYATENDTPEAITFSWAFTTTPVDVGTGFKPTSTIVIDSTKVDPALLGVIEDTLYGSSTNDATFMSPGEILALFLDGRRLLYNATTSYFDLLSGGLGDITLSDTTNGEFEISPHSRLIPQATPGFYTLGV